VTSITQRSFREHLPRLSSALADAGLDALLGALEIQEMIAGEVLIAEGTQDGNLFIVWSGQLDASMETPSGPAPLGQIGPGAYLGELSLLDPGPATATVTAEQGCTALRLTRDNFDRLCKEHPDVAGALIDELLRSVAERLRVATSRFARASGDAEPRTVDELVGVNAVLYVEGSR
jgi:CRP-like cAMP-binding protein